jgi:colicin import membrane protein
MRAGFTVSTALHAGLIALAILGLGIGQPIEATPVESIAVDLVPISDFSNIRKGSLDSKVVETEAPSVVDAEKPAEIAQPTGNTTEDQPTPEDTPEPTPAPTEQTAPAAEATEPDPVPEPVEETAPTPVERPAAAEPTPDPTPEPVAEPEPAVADPPPLAVDTPEPADAAPKPIVKTAALAEKRAAFKKQQADAKAKAAADAKAADEAKKAAEEKKKADDAKKAADKKKADEQKRIEQAKAEEAKKADDVAAIINNEDSRGAVTGDGGEKTLGKEDGRSATLSQSQIDGLVAQIRSCINVPPGAAESGSEAQLLFTVGGDGMLVGRPQVVSQTGDAVAPAYTSAVTRAVLRCGPYAVVAGQDVKATFRAKDF